MRLPKEDSNMENIPFLKHVLKSEHQQQHGWKLNTVLNCISQQPTKDAPDIIREFLGFLMFSTTFSLKFRIYKQASTLPALADGWHKLDTE